MKARPSKNRAGKHGKFSSTTLRKIESYEREALRLGRRLRSGLSLKGGLR